MLAKRCQEESRCCLPRFRWWRSGGSRRSKLPFCCKWLSGFTVHRDFCGYNQFDAGSRAPPPDERGDPQEDAAATHSPLRCPQCGYRSGSRSYMRIHARVHTGERPFRCQLCPSAFKDPSNLKRHRRCHTGERPFLCPYCRQAFSQSGSLRTHLLYKHGEAP
ncbi:hypothetical protein HPB47_025561 [Ixodes persulcatus]|uniref:Uncharacterized protein n=1 Tax=Ixodes persulcatus TaxID=34615 RepID=A0AC60Q2Z4_IXOPE|nr:hypothetical protein HPB47_025561 [Ixodes persulcatus]